MIITFNHPERRGPVINFFQLSMGCKKRWGGGYFDISLRNAGQS